MKTFWSTISLRFRLIAIGISIALFIWLPVEDKTVTIPILFAIAYSTLFATFIIQYSDKKYYASLHTYLLVGILTGAAVTPITLFLLALKTGLHNHPVPDYSKFQIISIIKQTPLWIIGGLLISMGLGVLIKTHVSDPEKNSAA
jgi:hypothetical protein